jgi:hypothetical protein
MPRPIGDIGDHKCRVTSRMDHTGKFEYLIPKDACPDSLAAIACNPK